MKLYAIGMENMHQNPFDYKKKKEKNKKSRTIDYILKEKVNEEKKKLLE